MEKNDNIFVKLQIEKDHQSGGLTLGIYFDKNAPNFSTENDSVNWSPTLEELDFIVETFEMISNRKTPQHSHDSTIKNYETHFRSQKKIEEPSVVETESKRTDVEPNETGEDIEENPTAYTPRETKETVFVQANDKTIDEVLKREKGDQTEEFAVEADEKSIINKVLKQKIKTKK
ncbi:MAG: hypothetical protein JSW60_00210 [Thermoplasmatales archaeon]|nr:MAG: hypothetical protein JSW60_00210 [Thermoplasmatales archaeon]